MAPRSKGEKSAGPVPAEAAEALSWDDLRVLEGLERLGSSGRVARELGVSVSKVYRRVARVEAALGAVCFHRGAGGQRLSDTGLALAAVARQTAASVASVTQGLRLASRELDGEVRLTTVEGFVPLIAPALAALSAAAPKLRLSLDIGFQGPSVRRREADVALAVMTKPPEGLWGKRLMTIQYGVYGTQQAVAARPLRWVVVGAPLLATPQADWEKAHAKPVAFRTSSLSTRLLLVRGGSAVGIVARRLAALHSELQEIEAFRLDALDRPAWLLTHPEIRTVPHVRAVLDVLTRALA